MKMQIDARGLSQNEVQTAIDTFIASKKGTYLPERQA